MCEREREQAYRNPLSHTHTKIKKSAQTNSIVLTKNNHRPPPPKKKKIYPLVVVESFYLLLPPSIPSHPIHLSSSPLNLIAFKNLHNFTSSTNRLLSTINLSLQHTSRTNRLLCAVNFSLKHASGSNGLLGAVDHFAELELLREGVVGEHFFFEKLGG